MQPESLGAALARPWIPVHELIRSGLLVEDSKMVLYGVFKAGKSTLVSYMGLCCAAGLPLFGEPRYSTDKAKVLALQLEMSHRASLDRYKKCQLSQLPEAQDNLFPWTEPYLKLDNSAGIEILDAELDRLRPNILIIDPVYKCLSGSENSVEDLTKVFDNLDYLISQYHFSLIFTAQGRKTQIISGGKVDLGDEELRGSTAIGGWVDSIVGLRYAGDTKRVVSFNLRHGDPNQFQETIELDKVTQLYKVA